MRDEGFWHPGSNGEARHCRCVYGAKDRPAGRSNNPHLGRLSKLFAATLNHAPLTPSLVAEKALKMEASGTWQSRYLVGPDAAPFVAWRQGMTDEQGVELHSADDEEFEKRMATPAELRAHALGISSFWRAKLSALLDHRPRPDAVAPVSVSIRATKFPNPGLTHCLRSRKQNTAGGLSRREHASTMLDVCDVGAPCFASSESFIRRNLRIHFEKTETPTRRRVGSTPAPKSGLGMGSPLQMFYADLSRRFELRQAKLYSHCFV
jgi:hypothetical protein